jgi:hypothetical protein
MSNPAAGVLVLLVALYVLIALVNGKLDFLFNGSSSPTGAASSSSKAPTSSGLPQGQSA